MNYYSTSFHIRQKKNTTPIRIWIDFYFVFNHLDLNDLMWWNGFAKLALEKRQISVKVSNSILTVLIAFTNDKFQKKKKRPNWTKNFSLFQYKIWAKAHCFFFFFFHAMGFFCKICWLSTKIYCLFFASFAFGLLIRLTNLNVRLREKFGTRA